MAVTAPYDWKSPTDEHFKELFKFAKIDMQEVDDDRLYVFIGPTGVGKSMLAFHALYTYMGDDITLDHIAGTRERFATKIKQLKDDFQHRNISGVPIWFDEADSDNLEQNAKWNKKLFSLYMKIRFLRGLHLWCWPSLKAVDRRFIEERINGIFFCYTKEKNRPRQYAYFTKDSILKMLDLDIKLNFRNLRHSIKKYALWVGHYKDYNGPLKAEYLKLKQDSGFETVDEFFELFAEKKKPETTTKSSIPKYNLRMVASQLGISFQQVNKHLQELSKQGLLDISETMANNGTRQLTDKHIKLIENRLIPRETTPEAVPFSVNRANTTPHTYDDKVPL